jgi:hypothetical protein
MSLRHSLAILAGRVPDYSSQLRDAGFECCHVNDDWIERRCAPADVVAHKRYLIEYAQEVLASDDPFAILPRDELNCRSPWLNELKARRLSDHGPADTLSRSSQTRHLVQLSPGWREFMRVRESSVPADQMQVADQAATFAYRQAEEIEGNDEAIVRCVEALPTTRDESSLQAFLANCVAGAFGELGMEAARTLCRNQALQRDEAIISGVFEIIAGEVLFVLLPTVISSSAGRSASLAGTLNIGFRLMTPEALAAPKFEFGRDTVLHLHELLPNKFNGYGRFDKPEEFCLNILAWTAALRILLPDVLQTLRAAVTVAAHSQLH